MNEQGIIEISTGFTEEEKYIFIKIVDNGPGIIHDDIEKLFEPSFSRKEDGNGLGLAIVEKIVVEHKGRIYCESEVNVRTEFTIELPNIKDNSIVNDQNEA